MCGGEVQPDCKLKDEAGYKCDSSVNRTSIRNETAFSHAGLQLGCSSHTCALAGLSFHSGGKESVNQKKKSLNRFLLSIFLSRQHSRLSLIRPTSRDTGVWVSDVCSMSDTIKWHVCFRRGEERHVTWGTVWRITASFWTKRMRSAQKAIFFPLLSNSLKRTPNNRLVAIVSVSFVLQNIFSEPAVHHWGLYIEWLHEGVRKTKYPRKLDCGPYFRLWNSLYDNIF